MSGRTNVRWVAMIAVLLGFVLTGRDATAQVMSVPKTSIGSIAPTTTLALYAKITSFEITGTTKPGEQAAFKIAVATSGNMTRNIAWQVGVPGGTVLASGTLAASPGNTYAVTGNWMTTVGAFAIVATVDPKTTTGESGRALADHQTAPVVRIYSDWAKWVDAAGQALRVGGASWYASLRLQDVSVNGPMASGGRLTGDDFMVHARPVMLAAGAPVFITDAVLKPIADGMNRWRATVSVPTLPWYPGFACYAGNPAPATANVPTKLYGLKQEVTGLYPSELLAAMFTRLGPAANWPLGTSLLDRFTTLLSMAFVASLPNTDVTQVMGRGPVSPYNPPLVPCGPVIGGTAASQVSPLVRPGGPFVGVNPLR